MSNVFLSTNTTAIEEGKLKLAIRDDVELEKGVVITEEYLKQHEDLFIKYAEFFTFPKSKKFNFLLIIYTINNF